MAAYLTKDSLGNCKRFLASLPPHSPAVTSLGPRAALSRFRRAMASIVESRLTGLDAIQMTIPFWECHDYRMAVLVEATSRSTSLPAVFYLDALRNSCMSVINKMAFIECTGYKCRSRPWALGVADAGTGKSPAADPHLGITEEACKQAAAYAPGKEDDHFHVLHTRTYAAMESKLTDTKGQAIGA